MTRCGDFTVNRRRWFLATATWWEFSSGHAPTFNPAPRWSPPLLQTDARSLQPRTSTLCLPSSSSSATVHTRTRAQDANFSPASQRKQNRKLIWSDPPGSLRWSSFNGFRARGVRGWSGIRFRSMFSLDRWDINDDMTHLAGSDLLFCSFVKTGDDSQPFRQKYYFILVK